MLIGVRAYSRKELVALTVGCRETTESWADLLPDCKRRGMRAPVLAIGDGAKKALAEIWNAEGKRCALDAVTKFPGHRRGNRHGLQADRRRPVARRAVNAPHL